MKRTGDACDDCKGTVLEGYTLMMDGLKKDDRSWPGRVANIVCSQCYKNQCNFCEKMAECDSCMGGCGANTCDECMKSWDDACKRGEIKMFCVYGDHNQCYNCGLKEFGDGKKICGNVYGGGTHLTV